MHTILVTGDIMSDLFMSVLIHTVYENSALVMTHEGKSC